MTSLIRFGVLGTLIGALVLGLTTGVPAQTASSNEKVLIRASKPYGPLVARIRALGGTVSYQFKHIDAIAAELPLNGLTGLRDLVGTAAISKDLELANPGSLDTLRGRQLPAAPRDPDERADAAEVLSADDLATLAAANPQGYLVNLGYANAGPLHAAGFQGQGVIVAVIDSGIRPGFPHISLDGSVVGCEDFVGDALGCSHFSNSGHGTFVAGMISANVIFTFSTASALRNAVLAECPACFVDPPTNTQIPMIGTAPLSSIYALRVFGATGGSPTSRILAALDRAIDLRAAYNSDPATGANIGIVNMSLGGPSVFPGRDLFDRMVDTLLDYDIVPVVSASNAGPASMTIGSPGSAIGSLTVGAASLAHNERILRRAQFGPEAGSLYRPFLGAQMAFFSSRGPHADGRPDPDVVANGFASFGQGFGSTTSSISLASGTSFAAPSVAGVAALLRQAFPARTARQIRNAVIGGANPNVLTDGSTVLDQGAGYFDAQAAANLLDSGTVPDALPPPPKFTKNVNVNVQQNTFLQVRNGAIVESASNLRPGERHEILYRVLPNTRQLFVTLMNVTPTLPPAQQNQLFGDDILFTIHSAKTSAIGEGDYSTFTYTTGGSFVINNPEQGLMRITVNGDWTNAGTISADVAVFSLSEALPQFTRQGKIADQEFQVFPVSIPSGVAQAEFRLEWREDWGRYPTADVDLILVSPAGPLNFDGATLNNPEIAVVNNPMAGNWLAVVDGFEIPTQTDRFELRISLDGRVIK